MSVIREKIKRKVFKKKFIVYLQNGMLPSNKNEQIVDTYNHMNKSQKKKKHYVVGKKLEANKYILNDTFYKKFKKRQTYL